MKLFFFFLFFTFIFVYVVLGYRYYDKVGLIKMDSTFSFLFPENTGYVLINGQKYRFVDNKLDFYGVSDGFYTISYKNIVYQIDISSQQYKKVFVYAYKKFVPYTGALNRNSCDRIKKEDQLLIDCKYIKVKKINSHFFVCDSAFENCRYLDKFSGDILGYIKYNLVVFSGDKLYRLKFY
jgi:hypothetical protein